MTPEEELLKSHPPSLYPSLYDQIYALLGVPVSREALAQHLVTIVDDHHDSHCLECDEFQHEEWEYDDD